MKKVDSKKSSGNLSPIWNLLRQNISKGQLMGYIVSNLVGLAIILCAVQFYQDSQTNIDGSEEDAFLSRDYLVLSKKVSGIGLKPVTFSQADIDDLQSQPWVERIGKFTSSQFAVKGTIAIDGRGLSTYMFFEAIPDEFFDVKPQRWKFNPDKPFIPIVLSKDYLALYNYGFAVPQGLPQLSESMIFGVPITLTLSGEEYVEEEYDARIVGFSSRLNTISVPQSFMDWANKRYAPEKEQPDPSRLIVEVNSPGDPRIKEYLNEKEIEMAGDKADSGKLTYFVMIVTIIISVVGVVICLLAIFILLLSIFLLIQKNRDKLRNLMLLGYSPREIGRCYELMVCLINVGIGVLACVFTGIAQCLWSPSLAILGLGGASIGPVLALALLFVVIISIINIVIIRRHMLKIWHS